MTRAEDRSTLRFYLAILRRRWLWMLIAFAIPVAIAVVITAKASKRYSGTALVVINRQSLADELTGATNPAASSSTFGNIITTYADAARSTEVADRVAAAVPSAHLTGAQLLNDTTITPRQDADVVQFSVSNPDPALALKLARTFADQFVRYQEGVAVTSINRALTQVDARLRQARAAHQHTLVSSLSDRDEQLRTLEALQTANNYVVHPTTSATQTSPRRTLTIGLGVIGGLILAALVAAALEALDTRVRSSEDVEELLETSLLGRLEPPASGYRDRVVSLRDPANAHAEGFRIVRTSLELQTLGTGAKAVMVTSSVDGEGKSLTLANLAVASARAGRKVVLIDMDLRRPTQHLLFETDGREPGVTDVLSGATELDQALTEIALSARAPVPVGAVAESPDANGYGPSANGGPAARGSLRLLRAGAPAPDPGELVTSEEVQTTITRLRERADVVYIDCPPVLAAGDAMTISRFSDAVVLVTKVSRVTTSTLDEVTRTLAAGPTPVAGFVVTGDTNVRRPDYS